MALMYMCSIYDKAAAAYGRPIFVQAKGIAIRSFIDEVRRRSEDNPMSQHPEDFILYYMGVFDDGTAEFDVLVSPEKLMDGLSASQV